MKKIFVNCYLLIVICATGACTFQTKHRGYMFPDDLATEVASIKTTTQLTDKFGSPMVKTVHGKDVWIYYGADEDYHGPFPLTWDDRTVLLAWVDGTRVLNTKVLHDADLPVVKIDENETEIPAAIELNAIEELFNNVGRFSPAGLGQ